MECLQIDWKNLDHTFERDDFYESIQAPKWIDFTAPLQPVDDHGWFCGKAGCNHVKELWQPPEDPSLTDLQKTRSFLASKKVPPLPESTLSGAAGKKAREVVSSSYSSVSSIKEAFAKHKSLQVAKVSGIVESDKHAMKRSMHASENQNPNQACELQPGLSNVKTSKVLAAKKLKTTASKPVCGKLESVMLSQQMSKSQSTAVLDVTKSMTSITKKDLVQKRSTTRRVVDAKASKFEHDNAVPAIARHASELKNKRAEDLRMPFSVYRASQSALTSSLTIPPKRSTNLARSLQNVRLGSERSAPCRPPRIIARNDHKQGVDRATMPNKQPMADKTILSHAGEPAPSDDGLGHVEPISGEASRTCNGHPPAICREDEEDDKAMHALATEYGQLAHMTLEQHLESLCLSTPGNKLAAHGAGHVRKQEEVSHPDEPNHVSTSVNLEKVLSQYEQCTSACTMDQSPHSKSAAEHEDLRLTIDCSGSGQFKESTSCIRETLPFQHETFAKDANSQISKSFVESMHITEEQDYLSNNKKSEKIDNQLQPVKDWQRNRGLKRKSSELNFKVNCSAKDHRHEFDKVTSSVAFVGSLLSQQARQVSALRSPFKAPSSVGPLDSCKEQHKKMKTTKVQPFKPFRFRTEERGALRELGFGKKEQGVSNPQELVHHALRMPSFGHPFRPQRSTKKLTIPKEPNFHSTRTRKACTTSHQTAMLIS